MIKPRLFLCSDVKIADDDPVRYGRHVIGLTAFGPKCNVTIRGYGLAVVDEVITSV